MEQRWEEGRTDFGISSKGADIDSTCRDGSVGVDLTHIAVSSQAKEGRRGETNDDSEDRILESLMGHLRLTIDTGEPTAITRMRMIPSDNILQSSDLISHRN